MKRRPKKLRAIVLQIILVCIGALAFSFIAPGLANAQEADEQIELSPLPEEVAADFDQRLSEIALQDEDIQQLQARVNSSEGLPAQVLAIRCSRVPCFLVRIPLLDPFTWQAALPKVVILRCICLLGGRSSEADTMMLVDAVKEC